MSVLLTGCSGLLGRRLFATLSERSPTCIGRNKPSFIPLNNFVISDLLDNDNLNFYLSKAEVVIHCAARVHVLNDDSLNPLEEYRKVNTYGTLNLARQAAEAGVKRFIFISTIKVNGESSMVGYPFKPVGNFNPIEPYALSKYEAEIGLRKIAQETGLEIVIIRPTLVYGPGVKANFAALMSMVAKGLPLPFGFVNSNKRSLVSVANLVDLIVTCIEHPKAANQVFLVSDDHDVSTASMVKHMSHALGKSCISIPVPLWCYRLVGKLTGKSDVVDRLVGSLQVDISHTKNTLAWIPPQTLEDGFKETAEYFLLNKNK
jgi:UDP-glucose 4-epimerase